MKFLCCFVKVFERFNVFNGVEKENKNRDFIKLRKNYSGNENKKSKDKFAK